MQELTEDVEGSTEFVDNLKNAVRQQEETAPLLQSLMEGKELEKWQQHFCDVTNVFCVVWTATDFHLLSLAVKRKS